MDIEEMKEEVEEKLKKYKQEHLLNGYENLTDQKKIELLKQLESIDFELINSLYRNMDKEEKENKVKIEPIEYMDKYNLKDKFKYYEQIGEKAIRQGKLAAVTMAGGQGTRLGHKGPKGTFDIGLDSHKSLFELLCDSIKKEGDKYGVIIPWFIMTSEENHDETVKFFEEHKFFGYRINRRIRIAD